MRAALLCLAALSAACAGREWDEAFDARDTGWIMSTWGAGEKHRLVAGGSTDEGVVVRDDGQGWAPEDLGVTVPLLNWIHGFSEDDVTVVGVGGTALRWNGVVWALEPTPTDQNLWGVWGASPGERWAVGGNATAVTDAVILRDRGGGWETVPVPALERPSVFAFFKVWGTGPSDVYIVGMRGAILHWDGEALIEQGAGTGEDLISLWGTGPDRIVAVGGRSNGVVATFDGTAWTSRSLAPLPGLNGVWMRRPDVFHAVGVGGTIVVVDFDTLTPEPAPVVTSLTLHAVFGDPSRRLTAVGGSLGSPRGPFEGVVLERRLGSSE